MLVCEYTSDALTSASFAVKPQPPKKFTVNVHVVCIYNTGQGLGYLASTFSQHAL